MLKYLIQGIKYFDKIIYFIRCCGLLIFCYLYKHKLTILHLDSDSDICLYPFLGKNLIIEQF